MKIQLCFKTPDVADEAVGDAREEVLNKYLADHGVEDKDGLTEEQQEELDELLSACEDEVTAVCNKFLTYGEYATIELDTETQEARVVPAKH